MCFLILSVFRRSDELETVFFWCKSDKNNCVIPRIAGYQKRRTSPNSTSQEVLLFFSLLRAPPLFPAITCSSHLPAFRTYLPWSVCMCVHHSIHTSLQSKHQPKTNRRRRIQHCVCMFQPQTLPKHCCVLLLSQHKQQQQPEGRLSLIFSLTLSSRCSPVLCFRTVSSLSILFPSFYSSSTVTKRRRPKSSCSVRRQQQKHPRSARFFSLPCTAAAFVIDRQCCHFCF